jgi:hypothetical protein
MLTPSSVVNVTFSKGTSGVAVGGIEVGVGVSVGVTGVGGGTVAAGVSVGAGSSPAGGSDCGATISVGLAGAQPAASRKAIISRMETIFGKGDMVDSPQRMI